MRSFLTKISIVTAFSFVILIAIGLLGIENRKPCPVDENITVLFMGDSKVQMSVDDKMIPNSKNLAQSGEPLVFSYYKLVKCLSKRNKIRRIYLGFSYYNLSTVNEDNMSGKISEADNSRVYFPYLPNSQKLKLLYDHKGRIFGYTKEVFDVCLDNLFSRNTNNPYRDFWGSYLNAFDTSCFRKTSSDIRIRTSFYENGVERGFSTASIDALARIVALCSKEKIELVLLTTPLHKYYQENVPEKFKTEYLALLRSSKLKVEDLADMNMPDSNYLPDGDHVSRQGSILVTRRIQSDCSPLSLN